MQYIYKLIYLILIKINKINCLLEEQQEKYIEK